MSRTAACCYQVYEAEWHDFDYRSIIAVNKGGTAEVTTLSSFLLLRGGSVFILPWERKMKDDDGNDSSQNRQQLAYL
ncbi:hypothetical protein FHS14_000110 [Paenibacillus baekrokdamisoli]|uniref:hypothetical protein n=1 Tax=Paenibacillus baekrokdamisoli TaxID=1712516 RepID=UPI0013DF5F7A|nr:hypothetical protein [Paenibacillus baekrokdamisoli]MBB3067140.1 hypothetical protein [Paenibacillus baekrokdamisoli]